MMRALYTAATGMRAEQTNVDTIANNLSNVNTTGFKGQRTEFKSLLYQTIQTRSTSGNGAAKPVGAQVGLGTRVAATTSTYTQGSLTETDRPTDFAIQGDGFFAVRGTDGQTYYTRNGAFEWSQYGNGQTILADAQGNPVDMNQSIGLFQFNNPAGLEKMQDSLLRVTDASGNPMNEATAAGLDRSNVRQGYLEGSNVQVADEMVNLIIAQRAYELNSKAIQASDDMLSQANQLRR